MKAKIPVDLTKADFLEQFERHRLKLIEGYTRFQYDTFMGRCVQFLGAIHAEYNPNTKSGQNVGKTSGDLLSSYLGMFLCDFARSESETIFPSLPNVLLATSPAPNVSETWYRPGTLVALVDIIRAYLYAGLKIETHYRQLGDILIANNIKNLALDRAGLSLIAEEVFIFWWACELWIKSPQLEKRQNIAELMGRTAQAVEHYFGRYPKPEDILIPEAIKTREKLFGTNGTITKALKERKKRETRRTTRSLPKNHKATVKS